MLRVNQQENGRSFHLIQRCCFCFFMLLNVKSFKVYPNYKGYGFISECSAVTYWIFTPLTYKKLLAVLQCRLRQIFVLDFVILIEYLASAVIVASSNPFVSPSPTSPRTKILVLQQELKNLFLFINIQ